MNNLEAREAFEINKADEIGLPYDEFKRRTDEYERITGHRYGPHGQLKQDWLVWIAKWNTCHPVPKGFVLVPGTLSDEMADELATNEFNSFKTIFDSEHRDSSAVQKEEIRLRWCRTKARTLQEDYKKLIDAQSK